MKAGQVIGLALFLAIAFVVVHAINAPIPTSEPPDRASRFIMLHSKGYNMSDAELSEYIELDAELHPTAAAAAKARSDVPE